MTGMLASVRDLQEATLVYKGGADIIDLKEPKHGALGAAPTEIIHQVVDVLWEKCVLSATIGDFPADPLAIEKKVMQIAETGVDFVKVGMFSDRHIDVCLPELVHCTNKGIAIIAVFFADMDFDTDHAIEITKKARLKGVMIDTARKKAGGLLTHKNILQLEYFVNRAKQNNLITGLAGSLNINDIPIILKASPDYIGFRTALCANKNRESLLDKKSIQNVRKRIPILCELQQNLA